MLIAGVPKMNFRINKTSVKNYLIANESYSISDISRMLNNEAPLREATIVYDSSLAKKELGIAFIAAKETLNHCISINKHQLF